jgi:hypothetical protein
MKHLVSWYYYLFLAVVLLPLHVWATPTAQEGIKVELKNPLRLNSIEELLVAILNLVMVLMVPVIVFFIILAGFKYVTARGNASQVQEATKALTYAVIGGVIILGAVAISQMIKSTVDEFRAAPTPPPCVGAGPC